MTQKRQSAREAQLTREAKQSDFWKEVFIPVFQTLHDSKEVEAYSTDDVYRRYALIEAVRILREFKMIFDYLAGLDT